MPQCGGCKKSGVKCVYSNNIGCYEVEYVKGLELRIKELEDILKTHGESLGKTPDKATDVLSNSVSPPKAPELMQGLGVLSLQASSEGRYLGPGSGVSFAQFTQSIIYKLDRKKEIMANNGVILPNPKELESFTSSSAKELPTPARAIDLANFYWRHSHTLYPFLREEYIMKIFEKAGIDRIRFEEEIEDPELLFQLYMVMAIGSTSIASITVSNEEEASTCLSVAMTYFDNVLSLGSRQALEAILLLISYSFFNRLGPDTWYLVGIASRLAIGLGIHTEKSVEGLDPSEQDHLRKVFWCLYMMDRVVSTTLGRPLAIRDQDINILPFSKPSGSLDVTLHILSLRRIAGQILEKVYTPIAPSSSTLHDPRIIIDELHENLIEWRRNMPFPLNESQHPLIPHFTTAWFDLNYYNLVMMLFRPSPLLPSPPIENLKVVANAASMAIQQFTHMYRQSKLSFNWLNLVSVFSAALTLVFITNQTGWSTTYIDKETTIQDLELTEQLLIRFAMKHAPAKECLAIIKGVIDDLKKTAEPSESFEVQNMTLNPIIDSTISLLSMGSDTYYDNLISQIDLSFLTDLDERLDANYFVSM
ncbi:Stb5p [Sugiyamaella lignohabitans]|uniref:Stb5p n=1 Tax=Sugiyamaella lignohabitans TaxID=796027 RepID=A0A161HH94_9ASCO|nr:Stb5p [Sugiyamaella lignohabitans]ANB15320.1 Stb5p [Sugiyamaella lignohabitans]